MSLPTEGLLRLLQQVGVTMLEEAGAALLERVTEPAARTIIHAAAKRFGGQWVRGEVDWYEQNVQTWDAIARERFRPPPT